MLQANPTENFSKQTETKSLLEGCCSLLFINQTGWFSLLQNNSTKVLKHRTKKEYNSSCGLAFWSGYPDR